MSRQQDEVQQLTAELNGLLFAISHDLRAPVRALTGFTQLLQEQTASAANAPQHTDGSGYLARILTASEQLQHMLEAITQLARVSQHPAALRELDIHALCVQVQQDTRTQHGMELQLVIEGARTSYGDTALLRMALMALIDNACKFSRHVPGAVIELHATVDDQHTTLCVRDPGLGFDMRYAERLGVPFQHLHAQKELQGVGIGLALVRRIAALHHGTLSADSILNQGSRFCLRWANKY